MILWSGSGEERTAYASKLREDYYPFEAAMDESTPSVVRIGPKSLKSCGPATNFRPRTRKSSYTTGERESSTLWCIWTLVNKRAARCESFLRQGNAPLRRLLYQWIGHFALREVCEECGDKDDKIEMNNIDGILKPSSFTPLPWRQRSVHWSQISCRRSASGSP